MFKNSPAFSSFSTNNIEKTKEFYTGILGLEVTEEEMGMLRLHLGDGGSVVVYPKENHQPATFTVLNFVVANILDTADALMSKGVVFEKYPGMHQDENGIAKGNEGPTIAWFKDPAGNILAVIEDTALAK